MKHALFLSIVLGLSACDQRASTPTPPVQPVASSTDGKKPEVTPVPDKTKKPDKTEKTDKPETPAKIEAITRTDAEWKALLTDEEYHVLREKGTERAFTGKYDKFFKPGKYVCAGCGLELFTSTTKFDSGCGWPAFYAAKAGDRVKLTKDFSFGTVRTEVTCARCDGHLGHVFDDAPQTPTGERFCINSVSIKFVPAEGPLRENTADAPGPEKK